MPPRISQIASGQSGLGRLANVPSNQQTCPICSISRTFRTQAKALRKQQFQPQRIQARRQLNISSTSAIKTSSVVPLNSPRLELRDALLDLQKHAANYVNISRLQLALRGLEQGAGQETIRISILGTADGGASIKKAKELLRLLLADPLKTEEEWERTLVNDGQRSRPIFLKVGHIEADKNFQGNRLVQEIHVSSPTLNGHKLEILVLEMDPPTKGSSGEADFADALLVPTMDIPVSSTGRYTTVTTPVHKSLIVSEGILGAASVLNYPIHVDRDVINPAVDLKLAEPLSLPFQVVDLSLGSEALRSFRESVDNALLYEKNWFASGIPEVLQWIKSGTASIEGKMKAPLRKLVESVLRNAFVSIEAERSRHSGSTLSRKTTSASLTALRRELSSWAERAHTELRDDLDIAFNGQRWKKLGWWKLFWRVDDVSMISTDILNQRFLTNAEKEIIFVAGRVAEAGIFKNNNVIPKNWAYKATEERPVAPTLGSEPPPPRIRDLMKPPSDVLPTKIQNRPWPLQIPASRVYLVQETIPALQALAQKLVFQTLSTSSLVSTFAGLMYISSITTTLYEAGGVAALGLVWSLRRMQGKWETARNFWEGEVREEGRIAIRAVEGVVGDALKENTSSPLEDAGLERAKIALERVEAALVAIQ
ncbi:hypothetical protein QTJ16_006548 [Diplocarpon rosae]|uniref:Mmc1 C-terminal domain-containing protein n=1 Tax=Diplocarpon rosae TaxID=946125 RepID=A0AAD9WCL0_9HELO|nr:hypothetical protein QTJ16_006548 [Diplocarpon rosae]PBP27725.1 hypothetical protein BUE80_DR001252 [Diplocarpon rosae]